MTVLFLGVTGVTLDSIFELEERFTAFLFEFGPESGTAVLRLVFAFDTEDSASGFIFIDQSRVIKFDYSGARFSF